MKRWIVYVPVNFLPFFAVPVILTVFVSGVLLVCAAAGPAPPMSITRERGDRRDEPPFETWT